MNWSLNQEDKRVRRTQRLLWEALMGLLREHNLENIRVNDICQRAMVHRTTFYKHYQDKYDLLRHGIRAMYKKLLSDVDMHSSQLRLVNEPAPGQLLLFKHVAEHADFYRLMLCKGGNYLQDLIRSYLTETLEQKFYLFAANQQKNTVPVPIIVQFYAGAILTVVSWWLESGMQASPRQMALYLTTLLGQNGMHKLVGDLSELKTTS